MGSFSLTARYPSLFRVVLIEDGLSIRPVVEQVLGRDLSLLFYVSLGLLFKEVALNLLLINRLALLFVVTDYELDEAFELGALVVATSGCKQWVHLMNGTQVCLRLHHDGFELVCDASRAVSADNHLVEILHWLLFKDEFDAALWLPNHAHFRSTFDVNFLKQDALAANYGLNEEFFFHHTLRLCISSSRVEHFSNDVCAFFWCGCAELLCIVEMHSSDGPGND